MADYGKLSGRNQEDMIAGARVEVAPYKRDAADFVLWKPSTEDLPGWDSPWGRGRPGWHLECSSMIEKHLGETIDIHGGGQDLIFPHHENEIAQSQCAHGGKEYVKYWMHNGYITIDNAKMSKSEGNFFTLRDILAQAPGEAVRYALLNGHYRKPLDWSEGTLEQSKSALDRLYKALELAADVTVSDGVEMPEAVMAALEDDLNTPLALSELHALATALNSAAELPEKSQLKAQLLVAGQFMGLLTENAAEWFKWSANSDGLSDADIDALIEQRQTARKDRDFARADEIRDELKAQGILLEDTAGGTKWLRE